MFLKFPLSVGLCSYVLLDLTQMLAICILKVPKNIVNKSALTT